MKRPRLLPAFLALALLLPAAPRASAQSAPPVVPAPGDMLLLGGLLFDALDGGVRPNPGILVRNGTILAVGVEDPGAGPGDAGPADARDAPPQVAAAGDSPAREAGVRVVRLEAGWTVLPGFFDLHAHYAVDLFGEGRVDEYDVNPVVFLANGVTSTFPAGEVDPHGMRRARIAIDRGERPGPRIYNSGPYFGTARPGWRHEAMTADSIRAEVALWAERGARGFKAKGIRADQLAVLIDAAHRLGLPVTAHLDSGARGSVNPADAIRMGIDRIEHFLGGPLTPPDRSAYASLESLDPDDPGTAARLAEISALYLRHGVFFDATLTAYGYFGAKDLDPEVFDPWADEMGFLTRYARQVVEARLREREPMATFEAIYRVKQRTLRAFWEAGGEDRITLGTDHPSWGEFLSGFGVHREMQAMVGAGIPAEVVLRIATRNGARALGVGERLGTVEPGKYADLVVVRGNPVEDITSTRSVELVMKGGRLWNAAELLDSVEGRLGPPGPEDAAWWKGSERIGGGP